MGKLSRILVAIGSISLMLMFFFPIWSINLEAPQFPEGIGLRIHLNTIKGEKPNDVASINNLNHYIGMKQIIPESIPELKFMPYIIIGLIGFGLLSSIIGKKSILAIWLVLFIGLGIAGMVDFYNWEYDYGHNLDPHAIIKIEGMNYQPPLVGTKQLLNFTAHSMPDVGAYSALFAIGIGMTALFIGDKKNKYTVPKGL
ncbi:MAG: hypothetical protein JST20_13410 [Bacteroidetes bacterium]|nr:hypothetical protein [Bacteroidota bacterium]